VSARIPRQWLVLRQLGFGYIGLLPVLGIFLLLIAGTHGHGQFGIRPYMWNTLLESAMIIVLIIWRIVGQYHARLVLSAMELCVPRHLRMVGGSLVGAAAITILGLLTPLYLFHGPALLWLAAVIFAMGSGVLIALFAGTRLQLPLHISTIALCVCLALPWLTGPLPQQLMGPGAVVVAGFIVWRLRALSGEFHRGVPSNSLHEILAGQMNMLVAWKSDSSRTATSVMAPPLAASPSGASTEVDAAHGRIAAGRSASNAFRMALEPDGRSEMVTWALIAATPIALAFFMQEAIDTLLKYFMAGAIFPLVVVGITFAVARARRLLALLSNQSGEIADLALLPGLGDRRTQRLMLIREGILYPLRSLILWLGLVIGGWLIFVTVAHAPLQSLLIVLVSASSILLLFAMMSVGVLAGILRADSPWFRGLAYVAAIPAFLRSMPMRHVCIFGDTCEPHSLLSLLDWQNLVSAAVLGVMTFYLVEWAKRLNRRRNLLCQ
jgi:hypothetical protein